MYTHPPECKRIIKRENRLALQLLAKYFLVTKLTEDINHFIKQDMQNLEHLEGYITEFGNADDDESKKIIAFAAKLCVSKILEIRIHSTLLTSLTPAMVLHMIVTVRKGDYISASDQQFHICCLATEYMMHHHASLDMNYFVSLTSEIYFPDDNEYLAAKVAIEILKIMEIAGWDSDTNSDMIKDICTAVISNYLVNADVQPRFSMIEMITRSVSKDTVSVLLKQALDSKRSEGDGFAIYYRIISADGVQVGRIHDLFIKPTCSIDYLRHLVLQYTNIMTDKVYCDGELLNGYDLISDTPIQRSVTYLAFALPGKHQHRGVV